MRLPSIVIWLFCIGVFGGVIASGTDPSVEGTNHARNYFHPAVSNAFDLDLAEGNQDADKNLASKDIRSIDFKNFTYHWFPKYDSTVIKKKIILRNGENKETFVSGRGIRPNGEYYREYLANVFYADLTGDGREEAIVTIGVSFYRWTPVCTFIFTERNNKAVLLWQHAIDSHQFELRGIKIDGSNMIFEEYDNDYGDAATCCPLRYVRRRFVWNGRTFAKTATDLIPYNKSTREFIGFPSDAGQ
jgi:hypothetical protein